MADLKSFAFGEKSFAPFTDVLSLFTKPEGVELIGWSDLDSHAFCISYGEGLSNLKRILAYSLMHFLIAQA